MLIGLDPLLSPDLLHALAAMGHGDEIVVADANFPAQSCARRFIPLDGIPAPAALAAILSVMPLDHAVPHPARVMAVIGEPDAVPPVVTEFRAVIGQALGRDLKPHPVERQAFYEEARRAFAIVRCGERRFYGNIILTKGVVDAGGRPLKPGD